MITVSQRRLLRGILLHNDEKSLRGLLERVTDLQEELDPELNRPWLEELLKCQIPDNDSGTVWLRGDHLVISLPGKDEYEVLLQEGLHS